MSGLASRSAVIRASWARTASAWARTVSVRLRPSSSRVVTAGPGCCGAAGRGLLAEVEAAAGRGVAELLLQEPAVGDQGVGVDPDHRVEDLVHGRAEQVELVDQQHQRGLAVLDRAGVGPPPGQPGVATDRLRQVVGRRGHHRVGLRTAQAEVAQPGHGVPHRRRHPRDPGRDGRRHHATGDHGLHPVEGGQDVGLGRRGRGDRRDRRRGSRPGLAGDPGDPVLETHGDDGVGTQQRQRLSAGCRAYRPR